MKSIYMIRVVFLVIKGRDEMQNRVLRCTDRLVLAARNDVAMFAETLDLVDTDGPVVAAAWVD